MWKYFNQKFSYNSKTSTFIVMDSANFSVNFQYKFFSIFPIILGQKNKKRFGKIIKNCWKLTEKLIDPSLFHLHFVIHISNLTLLCVHKLHTNWKNIEMWTKVVLIIFFKNILYYLFPFRLIIVVLKSLTIAILPSASTSLYSITVSAPKPCLWDVPRGFAPTPRKNPPTPTFLAWNSKQCRWNVIVECL